MSVLGALFRRLRRRPPDKPDPAIRPHEPLEHPDDAVVDLLASVDSAGIADAPAPALSPRLQNGHPDDWLPEPAPVEDPPERSLFDEAFSSSDSQDEIKPAVDSPHDPDHVSADLATDGSDGSASASALDPDLLAPDLYPAPAAPAPVAPTSFEIPVDVPEPEPEPWRAPPRLDSAERRAIMRASLLIDRFDVSERRSRDLARSALVSILREFDSGASVRAIGELAEAGATIEEVADAAAIKQLWREDPSLWLTRRYDRLRRRWVTDAGDWRRRDAMTWKLAHRLLRERSVEVLADELEGQLRDRWIRLRPKNYAGSGRWSAFIYFPLWLRHEASTSISEAYDPDDGWPYDALADRREFRRRKRAPDGYPLLNDVSALIWVDRSLHPSDPRKEPVECPQE